MVSIRIMHDCITYQQLMKDIFYYMNNTCYDHKVVIINIVHFIFALLTNSSLPESPFLRFKTTVVISMCNFSRIL